MQCWRSGFNSWVRKILWRRKWLPTPVFLPGESHGQRNLLLLLLLSHFSCATLCDPIDGSPLGSPVPE